MHYKNKKLKISLLHPLCTFSIIFGFVLLDINLPAYQSHADYINQTEIELVVTPKTNDVFSDCITSADHQFCDNSSEFISQDRFREIIKEYNFLIHHLYNVQKSIKNSNQGLLFFLRTKFRNRIASDIDQSLIV